MQQQLGEKRPWICKTAKEEYIRWYAERKGKGQTIYIIMLKNKNVIKL